jgi:chemotaxis protein histidine kinase CheA
MPLIEAALAFAITMLALSLIVSSFVEIIHRTFKMREGGLKYMLEQLFEHALGKYAEPYLKQKATEALTLAKLALADKEKEFLAKPASKDDAVLKKLNDGVAAAQHVLDALTNNPAGSEAYQKFRSEFIEQMRANRVPVGLKAKGASHWLNPGRLWGGLHVTALTPTDFMERLGSLELGDAIKRAADKAKAGSVADGAAAVGSVVNKIVGIDLAEIKKAAAGKTPEEAAAAVFSDITSKLANIDLKKQISDAAVAAGKGAAETVDTVLTDIAQKFDGFGKDAAVYFEGRARFMSVAVAIVLAFAVHADAVDLFRTYLRDPNARAKVIEQAQAIKAQYEAAQSTMAAAEKTQTDAVKKVEEAKQKADEAKSAADAAKPAEAPKPETAKTSEEIKKAEDDKKAADATKADEARKVAEKEAADAKAQVEKLRKDAIEAIDKTNETVKSLAGLGAPLGWTNERWVSAGMYELVWSCTKVKDAATPVWWRMWQECEVVQTPAVAGQPAPAVRKELVRGVDYTVWFGFPSDWSVILYLLLGGLLIGLGSPFWYDAVIGLTNIRSMASGTSGPTPPQKAAPLPPNPADTDKAQPVTPAGAFKVSNAASGVTK